MWIDRIVELTPRERLVAVKNVSLAEEHLHDHFEATDTRPAMPIMPASLIIEGMAPDRRHPRRPRRGLPREGHPRQDQQGRAEARSRPRHDHPLHRDHPQLHAAGRAYRRRHRHPRPRRTRRRLPAPRHHRPHLQPHRSEHGRHRVPRAQLRLRRGLQDPPAHQRFLSAPPTVCHGHVRVAMSESPFPAIAQSQTSRRVADLKSQISNLKSEI